jgi:hypothetical protein
MFVMVVGGDFPQLCFGALLARQFVGALRAVGVFTRVGGAYGWAVVRGGW